MRECKSPARELKVLARAPLDDGRFDARERELAGQHQRIAGMLTGLDVRYDCGDAQPLVGRRIPDLDLEIADGTARVFALLPEARAVLLNFGGAGGFDVAARADRVRRVDRNMQARGSCP